MGKVQKHELSHAGERNGIFQSKQRVENAEEGKREWGWSESEWIKISRGKDKTLIDKDDTTFR